MTDYASVTYLDADFGVVFDPQDSREQADYVFDSIVAVYADVPDPPDETAPVITLVSPLDGSVVADEAIVIDVTDNLGDFAKILVAARFRTLGVTELVHDGNAFVDRYVASSTRSLIAGGWRYSLRRSGGWPAGPTIRAWAIDGAGNPDS